MFLNSKGFTDRIFLIAVRKNTGVDLLAMRLSPNDAIHAIISSAIKAVTKSTSPNQDQEVSSFINTMLNASFVNEDFEDALTVGTYYIGLTICYKSED